MNVSLEFRTYEENGLLVFHGFSSEGFVKLFMEDARIKVQIGEFRVVFIYPERI